MNRRNTLDPAPSTYSPSAIESDFIAWRTGKARNLQPVNRYTTTPATSAKLSNGGSLNDLFLGRSALTGNPYPRQLIPAPPVPESSVALNVGVGETSSGICLVVTLGDVGPAATAFMPQAADELSLNYLSSQVIRIPASTSSNESLAPPRRDVATLRLGTILGGFKWSLQHILCWPIRASGQAPLQAFSNSAFYEAWH